MWTVRCTYCFGLVWQLAWAATACADGTFSIAVGQSRIAVAVQQGNRLWVYWPDAIVVDPAITAHDLPDLKPVWTHRPETLDQQTKIGVGDTLEVVPGIARIHLAGQSLVYCGVDVDDTTSKLSVVLDSQTGAVRQRLSAWPYDESHEQLPLSERWIVGSDRQVYDVTTGAPSGQLQTNRLNCVQLAEDSVVYLAWERGAEPLKGWLRRVQLPSGKQDAEIALEGLFSEPPPRSGRRTICFVSGEVVVLASFDVFGYQATAELVAVNLSSSVHQWSATVPINASLVFTTATGESPPVELREQDLSHPELQKRIYSSEHRGPILEVDLTNGGKRLRQGTTDPADLLAWHGNTESSPLLVAQKGMLWAVVPGARGISPQLSCVDLASGELVWRAIAGNIDDNARLATQSPDDASDFLVVTEIDTVHVFCRDTGELVGTIGVKDVGLARQGYKTTEGEPPLQKPSRAAQFLDSPWWDRLWLILFTIPLAWLLWRLARRRPVA